MAIEQKNESLFRTGVMTSEKFKCQAIIEFEEKKRKEQKELLEEINRRALEGSYEV